MNYLAIQATYDQLQIGLFDDNQLIDQIYDDKKKASKRIILHIEQLLKQNELGLKNLTFIAVNQGPAPFTSLRVVIASVNGISFATGLPLVGVDGLEVFIQENTDPAWPSTVALLNAFNNDVYYAIQLPEKYLQKGCANIDILLQSLNQMSSDETFRFIGNGSELFKDLISTYFHKRAFFPEPLPEFPSLYRIGLAGLKSWQNKENITNQVLPLYLKTLHYKKSVSA